MSFVTEDLDRAGTQQEVLTVYPLHWEIMQGCLGSKGLRRAMSPGNPGLVKEEACFPRHPAAAAAGDGRSQISPYKRSSYLGKGNLAPQASGHGSEGQVWGQLGHVGEIASRRQHGMSSHVCPVSHTFCVWGFEC